MRAHNLRAAAGNSGGAVEFDFTQGSAPSGIYTRYGNVSGVSQNPSWTAAGLSIPGDAPNNQNSYPIALSGSFTGDYLFQMSTRIDVDPDNSNWCSDAGIALFNGTHHNETTTNWVWKWGALNRRLAAQNNCPKPQLYGQTSSLNISAPNSGQVLMSPYLSDGDFVTMHFRHLPSQSKTTYRVTAGSKDWTESGTVFCTANTGNQPSGGTIEVNDYFSTTQAYYVGIGADDDQNECIINGFRYVKL